MLKILKILVFLFFILSSVLSCHYQRPSTYPLIHDISQLADINSDTFIQIHLRDGSMADGFLKKIENDSLFLECIDYRSILDFLNKDSLILREELEHDTTHEKTGIKIQIALKDIKSFEKLHAEAFDPVHVRWFYPGEEVSIRLLSGIHQKGIIRENQFGGIILELKRDGRIFLGWKDIDQIRIIRISDDKKGWRFLFGISSLIVVLHLLYIVAFSNVSFPT